MTKIILKRNEERRINHGHLWIFSNEIQKIETDGEQKPVNGDLVKIYDSLGKYIACGFFNSNSLIAVRVISRDENIDLPYVLKEKLLSAFEFRKEVYPTRNSFRMVFSESDYLPGLIIDKYNNTFVLQVYSAGIETNLATILDVLSSELKAQNIFTKHDEYFRTLEGLPTENNIYLGKPDEEIISDGFLKYKINFAKGQKTGFFFDQVDNRKYFGQFCKGKNVLDCFCNSGGFGLHATLNGAAKVTFVDSSSEEIENVKNNRALNDMTFEGDYICSDVFDFLEKCIAENKKFDVVNIDPPAFAKNKKNLPKAIKGYEKLNKLAMQVLLPGGLLFSSSCSHHLDKDTFIELIGNAAAKSGKNVQQIYFNGASLDHPSIPAMPETQYLKFAGFRIF